MPDKPNIRSMVDTGASVKRIVDYIHERLKGTGKDATVTIEYSTTFGWMAIISVDTGATLNSGCGLVHDQEPIETLVELFDHIDKSLDRYWELNKK
jgi:hypothetical protein